MEDELLKEIDRQTWMVDYSRRLQFRNELEEPFQLIKIPLKIPERIFQLSQQITSQGLLDIQPDQVIINEYIPGEGIRPHKDRNYYENQICGVNLGSGCVMRFIKGKNIETVDIEIPRYPFILCRTMPVANSHMEYHQGKKIISMESS